MSQILASITHTKTDSERLTSVANSNGTDLAALQAMLTRVLQQTVPSLDLIWQGDAKNRFCTQAASLGEQMRALLDSYVELNDQLRAAGLEYSRTDDSVKALVAKLPK